MLVWLADYLSQFYSAFSVVQYLTLRGIFAVVTALVISWVFGPAVIRKLNQLQMGQAIRGDTIDKPKLHRPQVLIETKYMDGSHSRRNSWAHAKVLNNGSQSIVEIDITTNKK